MLQTGRGEVKDGWADAGAQEGAEVLPQLPVILGVTQNHTWQGAGLGLALLAGYFTECNSLCIQTVSQNIKKAAIYYKNEL